MPALIEWWLRDLATLTSTDPPSPDGEQAAAAPKRPRRRAAGVGDTGAVPEERLPRVPTDSPVAAGIGLLSCWHEPHRRYHTTRHLREMIRALACLEEVGEVQTRDAALARVAAWLHDAVYDVQGEVDNEAASAEVTRRVLPPLGVAEADVAAVVRLVEDSAVHEVEETTGPRAAFHDTDLWVLSADRGRFDSYSSQVQKEYGHLPEDVFREARRQVLEPFLTRPEVYQTPFAREHWQQQAWENLTRSLTRLSR